MVWLYTLASILLISLIAFIGRLTFYLNKENLDKLVLLLVSFAAGTLLGDAFFHLIPRAVSESKTLAPVFILLGILVFFVLEKFIHWRHCHESACDDHPHAFSYVILFGDAVHNFVDGLIIAAAFLVDVKLGLATALAVALHEVPQKIGDFGSLVYGGFSKSKALTYNFISGLTAFLGAGIVLTLNSRSEFFSNLLIPFAAGGFVYIASSDIIPELHKTTKTKDSITQSISLLAGVGVMYLLLFLE